MGLKNSRLLPLHLASIDAFLYFASMMVTKSRLLDQVREKIRTKHYSIHCIQRMAFNFTLSFSIMSCVMLARS